MREAPKNPKSKYPGHVAVVRFVRPIDGSELITQIPVTSNLHRFFAQEVLESDGQTFLVDAKGEVVITLPTEDILGIDWEEFPHLPTFSVLRSAWRFNRWERHKADWTAQEYSQLKQELEDGLEVSEIAKLHDRTWSAIAGQIFQKVTLTWKNVDDGTGEVAPSDPEELEISPLEETSLCKHEIRSSACVSCRKPDFGIKNQVWVTKGGTSFHNLKTCEWLLKGQAIADSAGMRNHPIRPTTPGDARVDGYDPCKFCCPNNP
jgi:hypothetical protein